MPSGRTIRRVGTLDSRRAYPSATRNLGVPPQLPPHVEQERVYPRPLTKRETKDASNADRGRRLTKGYSDRAPVLTGTEMIDTSGKTTISAIPSKHGRSKNLSRSNAFRSNGKPLIESERDRILAFREAASPLDDVNGYCTTVRKSEGVAFGRSRLSHSKRETPRFVTEERQAMTGQDRPSRRQLPQLPKLKTSLTEAEIRRQVREAWFRGEMDLETPES